MKVIKLSILIAFTFLVVGCYGSDMNLVSLDKDELVQDTMKLTGSTEKIHNNPDGKREVFDIPSNSNEDIDENIIYKAMFKEKLNALIQEHSILDHKQNGKMNTWEDKWFNNQGILAYEILDFDSDGAYEMLVCYTAESDPSYGEEKLGKRVLMSMYEVEDDKIKEIDFMPFRGYHEEDYLNYEWTLPEEMWKDEWMRVTIVPDEKDKKYILCEGVRVNCSSAKC